jgi:hypothetical protein
LAGRRSHTALTGLPLLLARVPLHRVRSNCAGKYKRMFSAEALCEPRSPGLGNSKTTSVLR